MASKLTLHQSAAVRNAMRDVRTTEDRVIQDTASGSGDLGEKVEEAIRARGTLKSALRSARKSMG